MSMYRRSLMTSFEVCSIGYFKRKLKKLRSEGSLGLRDLRVMRKSDWFCGIWTGRMWSGMGGGFVEFVKDC